MNCARIDCGHAEALHAHEPHRPPDELGACWACDCDRFSITPAEASPKRETDPPPDDDDDVTPTWKRADGE